MNSQRASSATKHLVDARSRGEVERLERLGGREPGGLQPPFGGALLTLEQLQLAELEQVGEVVGVVGRGLGGDLLALGTDRREPQRFEVVAEQHHRLGLEGLHVMLLSRSAPRRRVRSGGSICTDLQVRVPVEAEQPDRRLGAVARMRATASALGVRSASERPLDRAGSSREA